MKNEGHRIQSLDITRGIAIFLVLWGHAIQYFGVGGISCFDDKLFQFIYSFHMPLFMLISGYLFYFSTSKRTMKEIVKSRICALIPPIIIWGSAQYLLDFFIGVIRNRDEHFRVTIWLENIKNVWFLWSVLICSLVVASVGKVTSGWLQIMVFVLVMPLFLVLPNRDLDLYMYPYFVLGFLVNQYKGKLEELWKKGKRILLPIIAFVYAVMLLFYQEKYFIYTTGIVSGKVPVVEWMMIDLYRWSIGLLGSVLIIYAVYQIENRNLFCHLGRGIAYLGKRSLEIYVVQRIVLEDLGGRIFAQFVESYGENPLIVNRVLFDGCISLGIAIVMVCIIVGFLFVCDKIPFVNRVLFARSQINR